MFVSFITPLFPIFLCISRKYLSDIALEAGKMKPDFTLLHQLPESDLKSEFQAYVGAYNKQWAHVRYVTQSTRIDRILNAARKMNSFGPE
jgi:hypothetical protein